VNEMPEMGSVMILFTQTGDGGIKKLISRLEDLGSLLLGIGDLLVDTPVQLLDSVEVVSVPERRTINQSLEMIAARMSAVTSHESKQAIAE
jgi:hypothetical protein